jgi:hypothetical protein
LIKIYPLAAQSLRWSKNKKNLNIIKLTYVDPLLQRQDLRRPGDELCECGGGQQLRVGAVSALQQRLALVKARGAVLKGHERLFGLGPQCRRLRFIELLAQNLELRNLRKEKEAKLAK